MQTILEESGREDTLSQALWSYTPLLLQSELNRVYGTICFVFVFFENDLKFLLAYKELHNISSVWGVLKSSKRREQIK